MVKVDELYVGEGTTSGECHYKEVHSKSHAACAVDDARRQCSPNTLVDSEGLSHQKRNPKHGSLLTQLNGRWHCSCELVCLAVMPVNNRKDRPWRRNILIFLEIDYHAQRAIDKVRRDALGAHNTQADGEFQRC